MNPISLYCISTSHRTLFKKFAELIKILNLNMSPKILTIIVLIMLWEKSIWEIYTPQSFTETLGLFGQFKKEVITVLFVDSAVIGNQLDNENADGSTDNEYGGFSSLFFNVKKMFTSNDKTINDTLNNEMKYYNYYKFNKRGFGTSSEMPTIKLSKIKENSA